MNHNWVEVRNKLSRGSHLCKPLLATYELLLACLLFQLYQNITTWELLHTYYTIPIPLLDYLLDNRTVCCSPEVFTLCEICDSDLYLPQGGDIV